MIEYKKYKLLTTEQKEEYDYRFRDKQPLVSLDHIWITASVFLLSITFLITIGITAMFVPGLEAYKENISEILYLAARTTYVWLFYSMVLLLIDVVEIIWNMYSEWKFVKNCQVTNKV